MAFPSATEILGSYGSRDLILMEVLELNGIA